MSKIKTILDVLGDGKWHLIEELLLNLNLSEAKFRELTMFLATYRFVKVDEKNGRVKITNNVKKLLSSGN